MVKVNIDGGVLSQFDLQNIKQAKMSSFGFILTHVVYPQIGQCKKRDTKIMKVFQWQVNIFRALMVLKNYLKFVMKKLFITF